MPKVEHTVLKGPQPASILLPEKKVKTDFIYTEEPSGNLGNASGSLKYLE